MNRRDFLIILGALGLTGVSMKLFNGLKKDNQIQPVLFIGHGSPMNALEDNEYSQSWRTLGQKLNPQAILVISAHWETFGSEVFAGSINKTIHDFGGFPQELFNVQYPAPANPSLATQISSNNSIKPSSNWGLDHGAWSVLVNMFPEANIPVIQLSLNKNLTPAEHFKLAEELKYLRSHGVLIIGSGNMVHNLRTIQWQNSKPFAWAEDFQTKVLSLIQNQDYQKVIELTQDKNFNLSHPSIEHFLPLIYSLGLSDAKDTPTILTPKIELGSISMASLILK